MPKAATTSRGSRKSSPTRKQGGRSRSRTRTESSSLIDDSSRSSSPSRRGRPRGRGRSRSPGRPPKTEIQTTSSKRSYAESHESGDGYTRARKKTETPNATAVPNGTHELVVLLDDPYTRKLRSADSQRTPRINTSIFDNISLTPTQRQTPTGKSLTTVGAKKAIQKQWNYGKAAIKKAWAWLRKVFLQLRAILPSWKAFLVFFLIAAVIFAAAYVYRYHWNAVADYYTIVVEDCRRRLTKREEPVEQSKSKDL